MTMVADILGLVLLLLGAVLCLTAAIGLVRFPDLLTRMHAGTKPQVLGTLLIILAVALRHRQAFDIGMLVLIGLFQLLTVPVSAHLVARAGYRTGEVSECDVHLGEPDDDPPSTPR